MHQIWGIYNLLQNCNMIHKAQLLLISLLATCSAILPAQAQKKKIDLGNPANWQSYGRQHAPSLSKDSIVFTHDDTASAVLMLKNETIGDAVIELDVRGRSDMDRNFVGLAFHMQDEKKYELVYFRPFNFFNRDTLRRTRSVQYTYEPEFPWFKLRQQHPGKYENRVVPTPNPDEWFHVRIVLAHPSIKVYVNNSAAPCLSVESLSANKTGKIGLHVGPRTRASFANLTVTHTTSGQ